MKIVGLLSFRDEAPYLPYLLAGLRPLVDGIVALDDRSVDGGPDLLRDAGAVVVNAPRDVGFGARRAALLRAGREAGGTHFVVVDADETFSEPFSRSGRASIERLTAGQAMALPFRTLWRSSDQYRVGREYDMPLTAIFCDDGVADHDPVAIHEPRLPGRLSTHGRATTAHAGEMVHLQFVAWHRAQIKQAWYRCRELLDGASPLRINARYLSTRDGRFVRTRPLDPALLTHLPPLAPLSALPPSWHLDEILGWFARDGPARFERLQIWHVPELRSAFEQAVGRSPRSSDVTPYLARAAGDVYGKGRAGFRRLRVAR